MSLGIPRYRSYWATKVLILKITRSGHESQDCIRTLRISFCVQLSMEKCMALSNFACSHMYRKGKKPLAFPKDNTIGCISFACNLIVSMHEKPALPIPVDAGKDGFVGTNAGKSGFVCSYRCRLNRLCQSLLKQHISRFCIS